MDAERVVLMVMIMAATITWLIFRDKERERTISEIENRELRAEVIVITMGTRVGDFQAWW